ncbi:DUF674 family protein [Senna tora]|uniref:DUF674 family protein n=1 Tax=Senna tora TaxID=362788 RepID=A0A835CND1_9FABA|nr:DUF674 family protein [Senna tora]
MPLSEYTALPERKTTFNSSCRLLTLADEGLECGCGKSMDKEMKLLDEEDSKEEAKKDIDDVDFLLNFLTIPLGSILKILDGRISVGCMQNLYASVKGLSSSWVTRYSQGTTTLLDLKVASLYGCKIETINFTQDLQLMPMSCASSISFLQKLDVPLDDLEQHDIKIDSEDALNLLGACLTSKAALTNGLFYLVKMAKEEVI